MVRPFDPVILTIVDTGRGGHAAWGGPDVEQIVNDVHSRLNATRVNPATITFMTEATRRLFISP